MFSKFILFLFWSFLLSEIGGFWLWEAVAAAGQGGLGTCMHHQMTRPVATHMLCRFKSGDPQTELWLPQRRRRHHFFIL